MNVANALAIENQQRDLNLEEKVNQYIKRVIAKIMGKEYAQNYMDKAIKTSMVSGTTVTNSQVGISLGPGYK